MKTTCCFSEFNRQTGILFKNKALQFKDKFSFLLCGMCIYNQKSKIGEGNVLYRYSLNFKPTLHKHKQHKYKHIHRKNRCSISNIS